MLAIRNQSRNMSPMDSVDCRVEVADRSKMHCVVFSRCVSIGGDKRHAPENHSVPRNEKTGKHSDRYLNFNTSIIIVFCLKREL
jgi:hypothetical protein